MSPRLRYRFIAAVAAGAYLSAAGALAASLAPVATPPLTALAAPGTIPLLVEEGDYTVRDFRFATGETLPSLNLHYRTLGKPQRDAAGRVINAVMVLHGTGGTGAQFLRPQFANVLFKAGGLLDPARWYVILPDSIGHGGSSKPSDGLHARFPAYDYADMVRAQQLLLTQGLKVNGLRLLMGTSMGCMHAFVWGEAYPGFARAMMPLACQPVEIAGRNRMWRALSITAIKADPAWRGGDYVAQPTAGLRTAVSLSVIAGAAPLPFQIAYPTRQAAETYATRAVAEAMRAADANDMIYALDASRTYNPSAALERITVPVTWVNSGDDFINPPELGIAERMVGRMPNARFVLIPAGPNTHGHGTHTWAALWQDELAALLKRSGG